MTTEKEVFVNMIKRISNDNSLGEFWTEEENGDVSIYNSSGKKTTFEFNKNGDLTWFY